MGIFNNCDEINSIQCLFLIRRVLSKNNSRKYNGTTYVEMNGPLVQHLRIDDARHPVYEVTFTQNELQSKESLCKDTMFISGKIDWNIMRFILLN